MVALRGQQTYPGHGRNMPVAGATEKFSAALQEHLSALAGFFRRAVRRTTEHREHLRSAIAPAMRHRPPWDTVSETTEHHESAPAPDRPPPRCPARRRCGGRGSAAGAGSSACARRRHLAARQLPARRHARPRATPLTPARRSTAPAAGRTPAGNPLDLTQQHPHPQLGQLAGRALRHLPHHAAAVRQHRQPDARVATSPPLPNGQYDVTVGVGDPTATNSVDEVVAQPGTADATTIIDHYVPTAAQPVVDGRPSGSPCRAASWSSTRPAAPRPRSTSSTSSRRPPTPPRRSPR